MKRLLSGLLSGLSATAPMTLVMVLLHRMLPGGEQYPLPPYEITERVREGAEADDDMDVQGHVELALISHFAFGAGAGGVYSLLANALPSDADGDLSGPVTGAGYGLLVWAANYLGLLPAAGLYRAPGYEPPRRHVMMITAHLVWGLVLGLLFRQLQQPQRQEARSWWRQRPGDVRSSRRQPVAGRTFGTKERYSF